MAAKFRKLDPRFWNDEKVQELPPEDKLVAVYCLTCAQANRIGLFCFSIGHAAEDTGIPPEGFRERFERVCRTLKWVFHEGTRTLYLPNWWKYNEPESTNVLIGALKDVHDVPESPLVQQFMWNERHLKETLREPLANLRRTLGEPSPIQEQEQEQEKEQEQEQKQKTSRPFRFAESDQRAAARILECVRDVNPGFKDPDLDAWANDIRLMRERDGRQERQIDEVVEWVFQDHFWRSVIQSGSGLRKNWDKIQAKRLSDSTRREDPHGNMAAAQRRLAAIGKEERENGH